MFHRIYEGIKDWARGRFWVPRLLLLCYFIYVAVRYLASAKYRCMFDGINLGIHEWGHFVFGFDGEFLTALGGTLLQLLAPIGAGVMFAFQRDYFAISVAGCWLATSFYNVSVYVADAYSMALPLVTPGGGPAKHDWNFILGELALLHRAKEIGFAVWLAGTIIMWASILFGLWILLLMATLKKKKSAAIEILAPEPEVVKKNTREENSADRVPENKQKQHPFSF